MRGVLRLLCRLSEGGNHMEMNRRDFLGWSAATAAGAAIAAEEEKLFDGGLAEVTRAESPVRSRPLVPAGSRSLALFDRKCVGCQLCIAACPHKVLRPSVDKARFSLPEMSFDRGWCRPTCTACAEVCPAGAIVRIDSEEKRHTHVGYAVWYKDRCLAAQEGVECHSCERHCPVKAIILMPLDPYQKSGPKVPVVDKDVCIGCGACEHFCPSRPLPAITLEGHEVHRVVRPMSDDDVLSEAMKLITQFGFACVLIKDGVIVARMTGRGVAPILELLDHAPEKIRGAWLVDRVIGRAAAAIAVCAGVSRVDTLLAAEGAKDILAKEHIELSAQKIVPTILNRTKTGMCPMEDAVKGLADPKEMLKAIRRRSEELRGSARG